MTVGLLTVRLLLRESRSLKDKRQVARSILDRLRGQFGVSACEADHLDDHRQLTVAFAAVGPEAGPVRATLESIQGALRVHPVAEYLGAELALGREVV